MTPMTPRHHRRLALLLCACVAMLVGCGGAARTDTAPPASPANVLLGDVADAGDLAGTVAVFEKRLARLEPSNALYAPTLERLALAHLELADDLAARAEQASDAAQQGELRAQSQAQRALAIARFEALVDDFAAYEGAPAALFLLAGERGSTGDVPGAQQALEQLVERYPATPFAMKARLMLADQALAAGQGERAAELYEQVIAAADPAGEVMVYARYRRGHLHLSAGEAEQAIEHFAQILQTPQLPAELAKQVRSDIVVAHSQRPATGNDEDTLRPYAGDDPAELQRMLDELAALRAQAP